MATLSVDWQCRLYSPLRFDRVSTFWLFTCTVASSMGCPFSSTTLPNTRVRVWPYDSKGKRRRMYVRKKRFKGDIGY